MFERISMKSAYLRLAARGTLAGFLILACFVGASARRVAYAGEEKGPRDRKPFVFNSVLTNGKKAGSLVLGRTTFDEAVRMYPAPPSEYDGNLRPVAGPTPEGYPAVKYVYNPWQTMYALFFDGQERLVLVSELHELGRISEKELMKKHPGLIETNTSEDSIIYEAQVQECVSLIAVVETKGRTVEQLSYAYTCE